MYLYKYIYIYRRANGIYIQKSCSIWTVCPCFLNFQIEIFLGNRLFSLVLCFLYSLFAPWFSYHMVGQIMLRSCARVKGCGSGSDLYWSDPDTVFKFEVKRKGEDEFYLVKIK